MSGAGRGGVEGWNAFKQVAAAQHEENMHQKGRVTNARDNLAADPQARLAKIKNGLPITSYDSAVQVINIVKQAFADKTTNTVILQRDQALSLGITLPDGETEHVFTFADIIGHMGSTYLNRVRVVNSITADGVIEDGDILQRSMELGDKITLASGTRTIFSAMLAESSQLPALLPTVVQTLSDKQFIAGMFTDEAIDAASRSVLRLDPKPPESRSVLLSMENIDMSGLAEFARERLPALIQEARTLQQKDEADAALQRQLDEEQQEKLRLNARYNEMIEDKNISTKGERLALSMGDILASRLIDTDPMKAESALTAEALQPLAMLIENPELRKRINNVRVFIEKPQGDEYESYYFEQGLPAYAGNAAQALRTIGVLRSLKNNNSWVNRTVDASIITGKADMTGLTSAEYAKLDISRDMQKRHMEEWIRFSIDGAGIALIRRAIAVEPPLESRHQKQIINAALELLFGEHHNLLEPIHGTNPPQTKGDLIASGKNGRTQQWALQTLFGDSQLSAAMQEYFIESATTSTTSELEKRVGLRAVLEEDEKKAQETLNEAKKQLGSTLKSVEKSYDLVTAVESGKLPGVEERLEVARKIRAFAANIDNVVYIPDKHAVEPSLSSKLDKQAINERIIKLKQGIEHALRDGMPNVSQLEKELLYAQAQLTLDEKITRQCGHVETRTVQRGFPKKDKLVMERRMFVEKMASFQENSDGYRVWKDQRKYSEEKADEFKRRLGNLRRDKKNGVTEYTTHHDDYAKRIHTLDFIGDEAELKNALTSLQSILRSEASILTNEVDMLDRSTLSSAIELMVKYELFPHLIPALEKVGVIQKADEASMW